MKLVLFVFLLLGLLGLWFYKNLDDPYITQEERQVNRILSRTGKIIREKYALSPVGGGVSMPGGGIRQVSLFFATGDCLTKEELRKLLLLSADELLNQINNDAVLRPALTIYPFTEKNICIIIYNYSKDGNRIFFPDFESCRLDGDGLSYLSVDPEDTYRIASHEKETYQEAVEAAKQQ